MASNNRKPQQRWPRDGNDGERFPSLGQRAQQRTGGAFKAKRGMDVRKVEEALDDMFLSVFDAEIIRAVAESCDWKLDRAVEKLLTLSIGHDSEETEMKLSSPGSSMLRSEQIAEKKLPKPLSGARHQPLESTSQNPACSAPSEMNVWPAHSGKSFSKPKRVLMNPGHSTIKVTYKGQADADVSDDDADVVIEEEKEFEVYGFDAPLGIPSSQPMCQFLTPLVTADQQTCSGMLPPGGLIASKGPGWKNTLQVAGTRPNNDAFKTGAKKSKHWPKLEKIRKWIGEGIKVMVIMRGCPGSGKTSLARHIIKLTYGENHQNYVFSADQFFCLSGKYIFNPKQLSDAHDWNRKRVTTEARKGTTPIIIDNTNIEAWEMKPYAQIAVEYGYIVELLEPRTSWKNNAAECERKNIHGVPRKKIEDMLGRFEKNLNANILLTQFNLRYSPNSKPPQYTKLTHLPQNVSQSNTTKKKSKKKIDPKKTKKKEIEKASEPGNTQESQNLLQNEPNEFSGLFNSPWEQFTIESLLSHTSNTVAGVSESSAAGTAASPSVTELMNWLQDHHQESASLIDAQVPLPKKADVSEEVAEDDVTDGTESSEDDAEIVDAADFLDDESEVDDEDLIFDGFEESDSGNELVNIKKESELENVNSCMEYVVLLDGSAIPQYDHLKTISTVKDKNSLPKRSWEYLVSQEEFDALINLGSCEDKSDSSSPDNEIEDASEMGASVEHALQNTLREEGFPVIGVKQDTITVEVADDSVSLNQEPSDYNKSDNVQNDLFETANDSVKDTLESYTEAEEKRDIILPENIKSTNEPITEGKDVTAVTSLNVVFVPENNLVESLKENFIGNISEESYVIPEECNIQGQNLKEGDESEFEVSENSGEPGKLPLLTCELERTVNVFCNESDLVNAEDVCKIEQTTANEFEAPKSVTSDLTTQNTSEIVISESYAFEVKSGCITHDIKETKHKDQDENCSVVDTERDHKESSQEVTVADKNTLEVGSHIAIDSKIGNEELEKENSAVSTENESEVFVKEPIVEVKNVELVSSSNNTHVPKNDFMEKESLASKMSEESSIIQTKNQDVFECIISVDVGNSLDDKFKNDSKKNSEKEVGNAVEQIEKNQKENFEKSVKNAVVQIEKNQKENSEGDTESFVKIESNKQESSVEIESNKKESSVEIESNKQESFVEIESNKQESSVEIESNKKESSEKDISNVNEQFKNDEKESSEIDIKYSTKTSNYGNLELYRKMKIDLGNIVERFECLRAMDTDSISKILGQETHVLETKESSIQNHSGILEEVNKSGEGDLLEKWESGAHWDEGDEEEKEKRKSGDNAPKPARQNRRQGSIKARSSSPIRSLEEKKETLNESVWSFSVEDPLKSWEKSSDNTNAETLQNVGANYPQPQRSVFASQKQDNKDPRTVPEEVDGSILSLEFINLLPAVPVVENDSFIEEGGIGPTKDLLCDTPGIQEEIAAEYQNAPIEEGAWGGTCTNTIETNTHHSDFILLSNINIGTEVAVPGVKVMPTFCRDITNHELVISDIPGLRKTGIRTLDKSSMTVDTTGVSFENGNIEEHVQELHRMFPGCPFDALKELFEKCNKDINWTVDLLLDSANQGINLSSVCSLYGPHLQGDLPGGEEGEGNDESVENPDYFNCSSESNQQNATEGRFKSASSAKRISKKDRNAPLSEKSILLKKQLEENIFINNEHYSEHVSRIRKIRHGELPDVTESEVGNTQTNVDLSSSLSDIGVWQAPEASTSMYNLRPEAPEWDTKELSPVDVSFEEEEEENIQLKLDNTFTEQLHELFGTASLPFKQDSVPTLSLPMTLARQLHCYLMEAEQNTYDLMMQEDEELARQLQQQEDARDSDIESKPADLREIMEMEMALAMYKADQKQFHENKDDMATHLKKNLLCEWFPSLPKDVLVNVFEAHDHSFDQTIEVLVASTEEDNTVRTVMSPEALAAYEKTLLERAREESVKTSEPLQPHRAEDEMTQERAFQDADFYRAEATRFYSLRNECQAKAQRAYQRGHPSVAAYYSQMTALHKQKIEESNAKAASSLLLAHSLGNLTTTLDLHFLYVVEALQVLDMFLDHHVHKLSGSGHRSKQVFVITGRGARSTGGRSRIKPAVVQRLEQRGLRHSEVNAGLLGITITRNSTLSTGGNS